MDEENNNQDFTITPPDLNQGGVNLGAGTPVNTAPGNIKAPNPQDYYPESFQKPAYDPKQASTENINAIADNFIYNSQVKQNPLKPTHVLGNFHTSEYGQNQYMDRYYNHNKFSELGFSPFLDNESRYNEASSGWDEFERAGWQMLNLTGLAFQDAMEWGDVSDRETARKFKRYTDIGSSTDTGKFGTNLFLNAGYTLGIMGELILEEIGIMGATAALGIASPITGGASGVAAATTAAAGVERAKRAFGKIGTAWETAKNLSKTIASFKDVNKAREYFNAAGRGAKNFLNPLENTAQFYGDIKKYNKIHGSKSFANLRTGARGFAEFYKDTRNIRYAYGEGALEGGMVENQLIDDLSKEWLAEHPGQRIDDKTAKSIRKTAKDAGITTAFANAPIILYSNKIVLDGLLKPAKFSRKIGGDIIESGLGKKIAFTAKPGIKDAYSKLPKGFAKRMWAYAKDPKLALNVGAGGAIKYTAANLTEGFQETFQEIVSGTTEDYYTAKYKGDLTKGGIYSYVARNFEKQKSPEGFEVFMSGFLMGGVAGPIANVTRSTMNTAVDLFDPESDLSVRGIRYGEKEDGTGKYVTLGKLGKTIGIGRGTEAQKVAYDQIDIKREEKLDEVVNTLNEFYSDPDKYLSPELENLLVQKNLNTMMKEAQKTGDIKSYHDFKDTAGFKHVMTALAYGRLGNHIDQLKELKNLSEKDIQETYNISKEEYDNQIDNSIERAERIEKRYNKAKELFPDPIGNVSQYSGELRRQAKIAKNAWGSAVEEFIFSQDSFDNAVKRTTSILAKGVNKLKLQNTPVSKINALFSLKSTQDEITILESEIAALEEGGIKKTDPKLKSLKKQLKYLEKFALAMEEAKADRIANSTESIKPSTKKKAKSAFQMYINFLAKENDDFVANEDLTEFFEDILDYASLSERKQKAMDAVNTLTNPQKFEERFNQILDVKRRIFSERKNEIKESLKKYIAAIGDNKMQQDLYNAGMFFSLEELTDLKENNIFPKTFFYTNIDTKEAEELSGLQVQKNSEDYRKAIAIVKKYYPNVENIPIAGEKTGSLYNATVRKKLEGDERTLADLANQFGFVLSDTETKVKLKTVLETIIDSKYATPQEKLLAKELLAISDENETITFTTRLGVAGEYTETAQTKIDPRFGAVDYEKSPVKFGALESTEGFDLPLEVVILRYELQRRVYDSLNANGEFKESINTLREAAFARFAERADNRDDVDFSFLYFLEDNDNFVEGVMTNKSFQLFLAGIPANVDTTGKNIWQKVIDSILDAIKQTLGNKPNGSLLNASMDIITAEIGLKYGVAPQTTETTQEQQAQPQPQAKQQTEKITKKEKPKTTETTEDIKAKEAEIEKRRKEELNKAVVTTAPASPLAIGKTDTDKNIVKRNKEKIKSLRKEDGTIPKENLEEFKKLQKQNKKLTKKENKQETLERLKGRNIKDIIHSTLGGSLRLADPHAYGVLKQLLEENGFTENEIYQILDLAEQSAYQGKNLFDKIYNSKINAKYDAELAALKQKNKKTTQQVVENVSEPSILPAESIFFTREEADNIKRTGQIERIKLIALTNNINKLQGLDQEVANTPAIAGQIRNLQDKRNQSLNDSTDIITTTMRKKLIQLGWNDIDINNMPLQEAKINIVDNVTRQEKIDVLSEKKQKEKQNLKFEKEQEKVKQKITKLFSEAKTVGELEEEYNKVVAQIALNENNFAEYINTEDFNVDNLFAENIDRLAKELNFSDIYVGNVIAVNNNTPTGRYAKIVSIEKGVATAVYLDGKGFITFTKDTMKKDPNNPFILYRYSEAYKEANKNKKGKEVSEEEAKTHKQSTEIVKSETELLQEQRQEALNKTNKESTDSFLDSTKKRCE